LAQPPGQQNDNEERRRLPEIEQQWK